MMESAVKNSHPLDNQLEYVTPEAEVCDYPVYAFPEALIFTISHLITAQRNRSIMVQRSNSVIQD